MANIATKFGFGGGGPFCGVVPADYITGNRYRPFHTVQDTTNLTTTATRIYYTPIYFWQARTFAGASTYNQGTGDNGEVLRLGIYTHSATNGPRTLVADLGEITLTAASAERVLSSSFVISTPGWYWLAQHHNTAASMYAVEAIGNEVTAVGYRSLQATPFIGQEAASTVLAPGVGAVGKYVDTAYGPFASTAVAPTDQIGQCPIMWVIA